MSERYDLLVKRGTVVLPADVVEADIAVKDGAIAAIEGSIDERLAARTIMADGCLVMAGVIDGHVHLNEPNFGHWEGFATGTAALAAGGCTAYADMPLNGNPPTVHLDALRQKERLAAGSSAVDYRFWGGLVPGNLDHLRELADAGVVGFKAFMSNPGGEGEGRFREVDVAELRAGMEKIAQIGGLLALHAESEAITSGLADRMRREGRMGPLDYAASRPVEAETSAVAEALALAEATGCRLHFVHISSPEAARLVARARGRGMDVSSETCPHYLTLTDRHMAALGPVAKCAPPLRDAARVEALWALLKAGEIDLIASDHSPCPEEMKLGPGLTFFDAWGGIAGAQHTLELMLEEGWAKRGMPLTQLTALLSANPARRFGFYPRKGEIAVGFDADLAIVDPSRPRTIARAELLHRHPHSPYIGRRLSCKVVAAICRGTTVYAAEDGIVCPGAGRHFGAIPGPGHADG
ncbi:allantoinase AllB [Cohnella rhizosphaerae]|uniref:Allantoinase n=1 Tax=Cohnella rhizosphaerae TaxID=1457232 RepID=A0A9X4L3H6_9BACL|nr:allantoinase AllB [Cohnella rhizosphaerae]MDG0812782.1 allantoinase AllB [Cohnella rhizosphaerae]